MQLLFSPKDVDLIFLFPYTGLIGSISGVWGWTARVAVGPRGVDLISGVLYTVLIDSNAKTRGWTWRVAVGPRKSMVAAFSIGRNCHPVSPINRLYRSTISLYTYK